MKSETNDMYVLYFSHNRMKSERNVMYVFVFSHNMWEKRPIMVPQ
jgi:hypothetical protein